MKTKRRASVKPEPCPCIAERSRNDCDTHPDPFDCPDVLVIKLPKNKGYGLPVRDGGSSFFMIQFCP